MGALYYQVSLSSAKIINTDEREDPIDSKSCLMFVKGSLLNNNCHVTNHQEQMLRVCTRETSDKERGIRVSVVKFITFTAQHYISTLHYKLRVVRHL